MSHWRIPLAVALSVLVLPLIAAAAPAGKVVIAQGVDPTTLDMMNQQEQPASNVGAQIFDMLVERDANLKLVPSLAAEMPRPVSPTVWEIKLRKGVKFHNGEDFNAESVKFSIERVLDPGQKSYLRDRFKAITQVQVIDEFGIRLRTGDELHASDTKGPRRS